MILPSGAVSFPGASIGAWSAATAGDAALGSAMADGSTGGSVVVAGAGGGRATATMCCALEGAASVSVFAAVAVFGTVVAVVGKEDKKAARFS